MHFCPDVPIILVGTKLDLREDKEHVEREGSQYVSQREGLEMAKNVNAVKYMECSALTQYGVKEVFEEAMRVALKKKTEQVQQRKKCTVL